MIDAIIARAAQRQFSQGMRFREGERPVLPLVERDVSRLLYLHVPFCESLCPYCSFNRVLFDESLCRDYFKALRRELQFYQDKGYNFQGIYVGGGTPTILIDELEETLQLARELFDIREISVETNPNHLTDRHIEALKRSGTNRLSVGIQSFDDELLKSMGRFDKYGSGESIMERLKYAMGRFDTLNADMIFNFPTQTRESLERDLDRLLETAVDQITYYPLMVSDSTRNLVAKTLGSVDFRKEKDFYGAIVARLTPSYRFSSAWCFSRQEAMIDEYIVDYEEYAGLGSGSIGYLNGSCYANTFDIRQYIQLIAEGRVPLTASRLFSLKEQARYDFLMKLFGMKLEWKTLRKKYGSWIFWYLWLEVSAFWLAGGLRYRDGFFALTERGRYYWVIMMREFFTAVNNFRDYCMKGAK